MGFYWTRDVYEAFGGKADVDTEEMAILVAIAHCMNDHDNRGFPSTATLVRMTHVGRSTVFKRLNTLEVKGILSYKSGGFHDGVQYANEYTIVFPPDFKPKPRKGDVDNSLDPWGTPSTVRTTPVRGTDYPRPSCGLPPVRGTDPNTNIKHEDKKNITRQDRSDFQIEGFGFVEDVQSQPASPVGALMDFCRTSAMADRRTFTSLAIVKGRAAVAKLLADLKGQRKAGKLKGIKNMSAFVTKCLGELPDES